MCDIFGDETHAFTVVLIQYRPHHSITVQEVETNRPLFFPISIYKRAALLNPSAFSLTSLRFVLLHYWPERHFYPLLIIENMSMTLSWRGSLR